MAAREAALCQVAETAARFSASRLRQLRDPGHVDPNTSTARPFTTRHSPGSLQGGPWPGEQTGTSQKLQSVAKPGEVRVQIGEVVPTSLQAAPSPVGFVQNRHSF